MKKTILISLFLTFSLWSAPKVGDTVAVDNYDGTGTHPEYMGTFKINKVDGDGYFYGSWVKVPPYFKMEGKTPTNYTSCDYMVECKKEKVAEEEAFANNRSALLQKLEPEESLKKLNNRELFKISNTLNPGDIVEVCYLANDNAECDDNTYTLSYVPAKIIKKTDGGYEVNARIFDGTFVGKKAGFKDKKLTISEANIRVYDPKEAPHLEITEDMRTYEVLVPGTLFDSKLNGKWYRAMVTSIVGYSSVNVQYLNWGSVYSGGTLNLRNPDFEFAPYGTKATSDTGAYSSNPFPMDSRGASVIDMSTMKKSQKCPSSMPYVKNGICVNENGVWMGAKPIRP